MPSGAMEARNHAERGQLGLALAGDHVDLGAADAARPAAMKSLPFLASRQAAVASTHSRSTCMVSHSARKRLSAASAFSTASAAAGPWSAPRGRGRRASFR